MGAPVNHKRMKPKRVRPANAAEKRHHDRIAAIGCLVCQRPANVHHIHSDGYERQLRDHRYVAPLCWDHHQGPQGIHAIGHFPFVEAYGIDLFTWSRVEWAKSEREGHQ